jgi:hypothetical protein
LILGYECLIAKKEAKPKGGKNNEISFLQVCKSLGGGCTIEMHIQHMLVLDLLCICLR